jgi:hypothetical protein
MRIAKLPIHMKDAHTNSPLHVDVAIQKKMAVWTDGGYLLQTCRTVDKTKTVIV